MHSPAPEQTSLSWTSIALMMAFGAVCGLPLPLSGFTLRQWMTESGLSLTQIGYTASIGLPYSLKFLWAPLLDHLPPPPFAARLGQRRGWLVVIQPLLAVCGAGLALSDPAQHPVRAVLLAACIAFLSASQDILIDAWRIETFPERQQGAALAAYVWGYRFALMISLSGALRLASVIGWAATLLCVAGLMAASLGITLLAPEAASYTSRTQAYPQQADPQQTGPQKVTRSRLIQPLRAFLARPHAGHVLAFVLLFKLGEVLAGTMAPAFYRAMGFDRNQVAAALFIPSLTATLGGITCGGWLVTQLGARRALVLTGFVQMASMGMYFALAVSGGQTGILMAKVVLEAFAEAMADAAFLAFLSGLCTPGMAATQYALLSSLAALGLRTMGGVSGVLAQHLGWVPFYGITIFAALPAMLIMLRLLRLERQAASTA